METKLKLTDAFVAGLTLPPGKVDHTWWDADVPLFGVRLRKGGAPRWTFGPYRVVGGRQGRLDIGPASAIKAKDARTMAASAYVKVKAGQDPKAERRAAEIAASNEIRFTLALDLYLRRQQSRLRPRSLVEVTRNLNVHARSLHAVPLAKVERRQVAALLAKIGASNGPVAANNVRRDLSAFFAWSAREGLLGDVVNPVVNTNRFQSRPRDHLLSDDDLRKVWAATEGGGAYNAIVRTLMLTGARREEIGALRWDEVNDLDGGTITLAAERVKTARTHVIPLSAQALAIIKAQPHEGDYVFSGDRRFRGWSSGKEKLDERSGVTGWRLHDLRRVFSTKLHEDLGVAPHLVEASLGHVVGGGGIASVYNRSQYVNERRRVLTAWSEHLLAIVEGRKNASNVMAFRG